jgi:hypothetical protein
MPKNDKYKDYARYAKRCLNMVAATTDQESRTRNGRRMAKTGGLSLPFILARCSEKNLHPAFTTASLCGSLCNRPLTAIRSTI